MPSAIPTNRTIEARAMERFGMTSSASAFGAAITPFVSSLIAIALANMPVSFLGGIVPPPLFALMPVYFWCLVRPDLMPPALAFGIGVLEDLFSGGPPGVWAASFVAAYAVVDRQRDTFAGLSGIGAILGFAAAMLVASITAYIIVSIYYGLMPPITPLIVEIAVSVIFYVPAAMVLGVVHRNIVGPLRSDF
jgi:rod shape-determining protein MreD